LQLLELRLSVLVLMMFRALTCDLLDLRAEARGPAEVFYAMVVDCCCCCCSLGCCRE
jgi:hypothetical protein